MQLTTQRLVLRPWSVSDADSLYEAAKDPEVGPAAGWPTHRDAEESRRIIECVLTGKECYAVCRKEDGRAVGSIELKLHGNSDLTGGERECELGYWIGRDCWGQGLIPEAAEELLRRAFEDLAMERVWCAHYEGNRKSARVQEKLGFQPQQIRRDVELPLLGEVRNEYVSSMTRQQWCSRRI